MSQFQIEGQCGDGEWRCVGAEQLAHFLRRGGKGRRRQTLKETQSAEGGEKMAVPKVPAVAEGMLIDNVLGKMELPVVVTRGTENRELVGIVTAFDLL